MALEDIERAIAKLEAAIRECDRLLDRRPGVPPADDGEVAFERLLRLLENDEPIHDDAVDIPGVRQRGVVDAYRQSLRQ